MESTHSQDGNELNESGPEAVVRLASSAQSSPDSTAVQAPPGEELTAVQQALHTWITSTEHDPDAWVDDPHRTFDVYTFTLANHGAFEWEGASHTIRLNVHTRGPVKYGLGGLWAEGLDGEVVNVTRLHLESYLAPVVDAAMARRRGDSTTSVSAEAAAE